MDYETHNGITKKAPLYSRSEFRTSFCGIKEDEMKGIFRYNEQTQEWKKIEIKPNGNGVLLVISQGKKGEHPVVIQIRLSPEESYLLSRILSVYADKVVFQENKQDYKQDRKKGVKNKRVNP